MDIGDLFFCTGSVYWKFATIAENSIEKCIKIENGYFYNYIITIFYDNVTSSSG